MEATVQFVRNLIKIAPLLSLEEQKHGLARMHVVNSPLASAISTLYIDFKKVKKHLLSSM